VSGPRASITVSACALGLLAAALAGCGGQTRAAHTGAAAERTALRAYLGAVEPLRLSVNRLLAGADPILSGAHTGRLSAAQAAREMGSLERRFAADTLEIASIRAATPRLRSLQAIYAHTYILEDSYLSALTVGLGERDFDALPDTQSAQRAAIIQWRVGLEVLARRLGVALPADLQIAGRGEIAPSPDGS
jgi:hypothetical protein